jgi:hypothetical protein
MEKQSDATLSRNRSRNVNVKDEPISGKKLGEYTHRHIFQTPEWFFDKENNIIKT